MLLDSDSLASDPTIEDMFRGIPNLRELDLGWLGPDAIRALQGVGHIIGSSLRSLTLSDRRSGPPSFPSRYSKTDVFSGELFAGFTALEKLKVELQDLNVPQRQSSSSPPSARPSMSPEPESNTLDPFGAAGYSQHDFGSTMDISSDFFSPPLPLNDILPSMADPSMTAMTGVPGFAWMSSQPIDFHLGFFPSATTAGA